MLFRTKQRKQKSVKKRKINEDPIEELYTKPMQTKVGLEESCLGERSLDIFSWGISGLLVQSDDSTDPHSSLLLHV